MLCLNTVYSSNLINFHFSHIGFSNILTIKPKYTGLCYPINAISILLPKQVWQICSSTSILSVGRLSNVSSEKINDSTFVNSYNQILVDNDTPPTRFFVVMSLFEITFEIEYETLKH